MNKEIHPVETQNGSEHNQASGQTRREAIATLLSAAAGAAACFGCGLGHMGMNQGQSSPGATSGSSTALGTVNQLKASKDPVPVTVNGSPAFVEFNAGIPTVISAICPHRGCTVAFDDASDEFVCPCHGSVFSRNGSFVKGVANAALPVITSHVDGDTLYAG